MRSRPEVVSLYCLGPVIDVTDLLSNLCSECLKFPMNISNALSSAKSAVPLLGQNKKIITMLTEFIHSPASVATTLQS